MKKVEKYFSEFLGTFILLLSIVGSGIMGTSLSSNESVTLLANAISIGLTLFVLIVTLRQVSGAHFNPAVTIVCIILKKIKFRNGLIYIIVQIIGGCLGVVFANLIFDLEPIQYASKVRGGSNTFLSEIFATFGLLFFILRNGKKNDVIIGSIVGSYITAAIWFTSSTSFTNPAVSIARSLTDTFTGIHISNVPMFILAQLISIIITFVVIKKFFR